MARPRSIPEEEVIERALLVFWSRGYDRTSIADLSEAIGVGPSSLYNSFGSKANFYKRVLEHYMVTRASFASDVMEKSKEKSIDEGIRLLLRGAVKLYTRRDSPLGCALLQSGSGGNSEDSEAGGITLAMTSTLEEGIRGMIEARASKGDLLVMPARVLAKFVLCTMRGLSQLAHDGVGARDLLQIADHVGRSCVNPP